MTPADVRERLVDALQADLVGPFLPDDGDSSQETLPIAPSRWYLTGFLAPKLGRKPEADDLESTDEGLGGGEQSQAEDAGSDEAEQKRPVRYPASMGLSVFLPPGNGDSIDVRVWYADYDKVDVPIEHTERKHSGWKRVPHGPVLVNVPLDAIKLKKSGGFTVPESRGLVIRCELRETSMKGLEPGTRVLSLFLVNERTAIEKDKDLSFAFQVRMELAYERGFVPRPNRRGESSEDDDQRVLALLFRDYMEWAVGHNTSVAQPESEDGKVTHLRTTQLPTFEVPAVKHREFPELTTSMLELGKMDAKAVEGNLVRLIERYESWIAEQEATPLDREPLLKTRGYLVARANQIRNRIAEGIALLKRDAVVFRAFQLANQAMHVAAIQGDLQREDPRYRGGVVPAWRPFQLAFVLMSLPSVADPLHADRDLADLVYFPTGGGKTEAYLGVIAFALLLRRLRGKKELHEGRGVAVILRYTLRLLTLDQLGRASTLVCALERLRSRYPAELGNSRLTIGLWVGASASANRLKELHQVLHDFSSGKTESPFPLTNCPWCGEKIKIQNIKLVDSEGKPTKKNFVRAVVYCDGDKCDFTEAKQPGRGLPVLFVDEQIYSEVPSFIVATVDKFAMVPWRGDAGTLFGRIAHADEQRAYGVMETPPATAKAIPGGFLPPELIVQDELHLISGPLGTMVGLYETAVDYLCQRQISDKFTRPKVICSTATVRRARDQIRAIFGREMVLFPPRGVNEGDNFFANLDRKSKGRLYVGLGAPGRALRAISVRSYATLLAAAQKHFDKRGEPKQPADPYMTLVGYFNSLRELGGMRRLVEDEVRNRVANITEAFSGRVPLLHVGSHPWAEDRKLKLPLELTSRVSTADVKDTKRRLAARHAGDDVEPIDVVLASNMISVGLDIDRLGLMVVTGQPKTSSEYIQATSRVGRAYPGLVVTCLNVMRPRDRSHYERFVAYHDSFYREVEATSVTPFSGQALDRGLVGLLLSMVRHGIQAMEPARGVMELHPHRAEVERILAWVVTRAQKHRRWHDAGAEERIGHLLRERGKSFFDAWEKVIDKAIEGAAVRVYSKNDRTGTGEKALMYAAGEDPPENSSHNERLFRAPTSMRDVEPSVHVWLRYLPLDERS